jgi:hypothetical protein
MPYNAKIKFSYINDSESTPSSYFPDIVDQQTITIEAPAQDLNVHQYYELFKSFLRSIGFAEYSIMEGGCRIAFNDENDPKQMNKLMEEYELQDKQTYSDKDYDELYQKYEKLQAKLSHFEKSDEDLDSIPMFVEFNGVTKETLKQAYQVCNDCGEKYGNYVAGMSSHWMAKCDICGEDKAVTESRDYNYLQKGIKEIVK